MAAILLDVDGVFHVSRDPIAGGAEAVARLREDGHRIRFVTNSTTQTRAALAEQLRGMGIELDDEELQTPETNLVFSYMNLARAFHELEGGAELYSLHKNRWWQTKHGPALDAGAFVAGLEYATQIEATVIGKPSTAYFEAALNALDADARMTWMVGDDIEADIAGGQAHGMRTILVRTGKFRPDAVEATPTRPDGIISSIAQLPDWLEEHL
jgi:ribonucleotide monophosphatase NagD (HAD superfamily)